MSTYSSEFQALSFKWNKRTLNTHQTQGVYTNSQLVWRSEKGLYTGFYQNVNVGGESVMNDWTDLGRDRKKDDSDVS